jgi:hypothetical protein
MVLFYYYKTEKEMITLKTNWDEVLKEILKKPQMTEGQEKKEITVTGEWVVCSANGSKCNICGAFIDDVVCNSGHILGGKYEVPVSN